MVKVCLSLALTRMILITYLIRLIHGLPRDTSTLSVFLPLGPTEQSGYKILLAGRCYLCIFPPMVACNDVDFVCSALYSELLHSRIALKVPFFGLIFPNVTTFFKKIAYLF